LYDQSLLQDVKGFKQGAENFYEIEYRYKNINRIIENRTKEKMYFLNYILKHHIIDCNFYRELVNIVKSDYKISKLYVLGLISDYEL
jgi:intein/homing endonuclease